MKDLLKVGILGLQGAIQEHVQAVEECGVQAVIIKNVEQLVDLDGLILPGGESTTMRRLLDQYHFVEPIQAFAQSGKPIFGTCAGLILLAKKINGTDEVHLGLMDVVVERNSFGRQRDSFEADIAIAGLTNSMTAVFIRAPHITEAGENVEVLAKYDGRIVAVKEGSLLACSFHPELTDDHSLTNYFIEMIRKTQSARQM
ncbi:pyridoxal 5'-phosphate synthase glutaminase subunit PdxT [Lederbergia lenta]|uniref:Pyridoxal 5'-phosphate synthase subunit PdxT n=1 Tax=Lederbergia lenta TaxID=1467 RepID=A0A2X4YRR4_LEDLE|nr:pyridoxal 5'-phosphate synthase glutaminase subunit PdxT [Lederbergia lenta]MEC2323792.1 pyridoxal 5'-phosphate synthase glutaminase subunit PdxT [Lederbergia lenta]SQI51054.1 glutamine amidotransferase [Lederbergia lenta]